jgi:hypothetical protein
MRRLLLVLVTVSVLAAGSLASASGNPADRLVLTKQDVGDSYVYNGAFSHPDSLAELGTGASAAVKRELARKWLAGTARGFNSVTATRSLVSTADVFRTPELDAIIRSFERRFLSLSHGRLLRVPAGAPGTHRFLIRGRMQSFVALIYIWQHGRDILTVWQIATPAALRPGELFALTHRQDAKAR